MKLPARFPVYDVPQLVVGSGRGLMRALFDRSLTSARRRLLSEEGPEFVKTPFPQIRRPNPKAFGFF
jgi:hypothetical protein